MAIFADQNTRLICQGFTGRHGTFHSSQCIEYGTQFVGGVTPGKGGTQHLERPVFNTVHEAVQATNANATMIYVPAAFAADAILEAMDARIGLIVCITEGVPIHDMIRVKGALRHSTSRLIGPNCPGIITPDACKIGIMPGSIHKKGSFGVVSRSGTLTYEAVHQLTQVGLGQSTCVGIGGDPIKGLGFVEVLEAFWSDPETKGIFLIGEIGGQDEQEAATFIDHQRRQGRDKPVMAFIAGISAPEGKKMGHAGAIVSGEGETAQAKVDQFRSLNITVVESLAHVGSMAHKIMQR